MESTHSPRNRLLAALPSDVYRQLLPEWERVPLVFKQVLVPQHARIEHVYFPEGGVCSMLRQTPGAMPVEVATVGLEGMVGFGLLLGDDASHEEIVCQVPGAALRTPARSFLAAVDAHAALRRICLRSTQTLIGQIAQAAACNRIHNVEERAARWLLMTHDRVGNDEFPLTQEFLAQMLGVRRQAVNVAAGMLQQAGLISYARGIIRILDRAGLEEASCECYGLIRAQFARVIGWERER